MPTSDSERRYSQEEFALVLRIASEEPDAPDDDESLELTPAREGLTLAQIQEIAEMKMADLNAASMEAAMRIIEGTARSCGITVED